MCSSDLYCVHESLEGRRGIAHSKEHYFRLKEPSACFECAFPLIRFADPDVVIPPTHVEFTEYLHSLQIFDTLCKVWEWGDVFASDGVEGSIIDNVPHFVRVFLWYHKR